jgi:hypothetical protein
MPAMNNITVTPEYLRKVADLKRQQLAIDEQMSSLSGIKVTKQPKRHFSEATKAKIAAAARRRWAKVKRQGKKHL